MVKRGTHRRPSDPCAGHGQLWQQIRHAPGLARILGQLCRPNCTQRHRAAGRTAPGSNPKICTTPHGYRHASRDGRHVTRAGGQNHGGQGRIHAHAARTAYDLQTVRRPQFRYLSPADSRQCEQNLRHTRRRSALPTQARRDTCAVPEAPPRTVARHRTQGSCNCGNWGQLAATRRSIRNGGPLMTKSSQRFSTNPHETRAMRGAA